MRTLAVADTNAALYPITHPLVAQSLARACRRSPRPGDVRIRGRHRQHLQGHPVRREPGVPRGERHLPQAHRRAARQRDLGGDVLLLDDRRGGRGAHRPARRSGVSGIDAAAARSSSRATCAGSRSPRPPRSKAAATRSATARSAPGRARATTPAWARCATSSRRPSSGACSRWDGCRRVVESMLDNLLQDPAAVLGLTAIKGHDDYTLNHSINVCILSISLGTALGLDQDELRSPRAGGAALRHRQGARARGRAPQVRPPDRRGVGARQAAFRGRRRPPQAPADRRQDADGGRLRAPPAPRPDGLSRLQPAPSSTSSPRSSPCATPTTP